MKKISIFIFSSLLLFFSSCSYLFNNHGQTWVVDCEHGRLDVTAVVDGEILNYTIYAFPQEGHCLLPENLFVYKSLSTTISIYTYPVIETGKNEYSCTVEKNADYIITAYFTELENE